LDVFFIQHVVTYRELMLDAVNGPPLNVTFLFHSLAVLSRSSFHNWQDILVLAVVTTE
jgi:hypothetical protein